MISVGISNHLRSDVAKNVITPFYLGKQLQWMFFDYTRWRFYVCLYFETLGTHFFLSKNNLLRESSFCSLIFYFASYKKSVQFYFEKNIWL